MESVNHACVSATDFQVSSTGALHSPAVHFAAAVATTVRVPAVPDAAVAMATSISAIGPARPHYVALLALGRAEVGRLRCVAPPPDAARASRAQIPCTPHPRFARPTTLLVGAGGKDPKGRPGSSETAPLLSLETMVARHPQTLLGVL